MNLGLNLKTLDAIDFASKNFRATDVVYCRWSQYTYLEKVSNATRLLALNPENLPNFIDVLNDLKIMDIGYGLDDSPEIDNLLSGQKVMYDQALKMGKRLTFVPDGRSLTRWPTRLSRFCHAIVFQAQYFQSESNDLLLYFVKSIVNTIHVTYPKKPIWLQILVNSANLQVQDTLSLIQLISKKDIEIEGLYLAYEPPDWDKAEAVLTSVIKDRTV